LLILRSEVLQFLRELIPGVVLARASVEVLQFLALFVLRLEKLSFRARLHFPSVHWH